MLRGIVFKRIPWRLCSYGRSRFCLVVRRRLRARWRFKKVASAGVPYAGQRSPIVARCKSDNRSSFMRGIFTDGVDRLGSQAKTILISHLQQTGRFNVLDRDNMPEIKQEAEFAKTAQSNKGASYVVTGDVTEFWS